MTLSHSTFKRATFQTAAAADGLRRGTFAEAGVDPVAVEALLRDVAAEGLDLHAIMIHRNGVVAHEAYAWPYRAGKPQIMHSVAKSFTATAIGLALDEGLFAIDDKVISFFPDDLPAVVDAKLAAMTVEDLLTMRTGHAAEVGGPQWRAIETSWIREFFKIPVVHQPGTTYVYSSAVSYMLAAILYKTSGLSLRDYLKPRLFAPLGITGETWDIGPDGFNPGGNGLTCKLVDILKLGILHADKGMWEGQRLVPEAWVATATRQHVEDYGYHWVVYDNGVFAANGQFVQMVFVFPEQGATIGVTAAIDGSIKLRPHVFRHFPAGFVTPGPDSASAEAALQKRTTDWTHPPALRPQANSTVLRPGRTAFTVDANPLGVTKVAFDLTASRVTFALSDAEGTYPIVCGTQSFIEGISDMPGRELHHGYRLRDAAISAGARFVDPSTLQMLWYFNETAFHDTVTCTFDGDRVRIERTVNINSADMAWPVLTGRLKSE